MSAQAVNAAALLILLKLRQKRKQKREIENKKRRLWVREWVARREKDGFYNNLLRELRAEDDSVYTNFVRMSPTDFDHLLELVSPAITKQTTQMRQPISAGERLALTLRFLATFGTAHVNYPILPCSRCLIDSLWSQFRRKMLLSFDYLCRKHWSDSRCASILPPIQSIFLYRHHPNLSPLFATFDSLFSLVHFLRPF